MVGAADLQHLAVARSVLQARPADWSLASELGWFDQALGCYQLQGLQCGLGLICNVATLSCFASKTCRLVFGQ